MKAKPYKLENGTYAPCTPDEATHIRMNLPGRIPYCVLPIIIKGSREGTNRWSWNGSTESPTLKPSLLRKSGDEKGEIICHSWINNGKIIFLKDSNHELSGETCDLLEVD